MELKASLEKPYTDSQRIEFIVHYNHELGYNINETETALEAYGYTDQELADFERQRIMMLSLTKREVFLALYRDKGITPEQIRAQITDPEALIEFDYATEYYRGNPLINVIGAQLGYTSEDLDRLFLTKSFEIQEQETNND